MEFFCDEYQLDYSIYWLVNPYKQPSFTTSYICDPGAS